MDAVRAASVRARLRVRGGRARFQANTHSALPPLKGFLKGSWFPHGFHILSDILCPPARSDGLVVSKRCGAQPRASGLSIPHRAALRSVRLSIDDEYDANKPKVTMEGIMAFRERQRLRAEGKPLHEWSSTTDRQYQDPEWSEPEDHEPVPPTADQSAAADALFETLLREGAPGDGFGEGFEHLF